MGIVPLLKQHVPPNEQHVVWDTHPSQSRA
jgi:hypothetical protein